MDNTDDFGIDPDIAATLGFSGFGNQGKKRKFANDAFVDPGSSENPNHGSSGKPNTPTEKTASAGNAVPLGKRREIAGRPKVEPSSTAPLSSGAEPTLEQLQYGVRNEKGDLAIFMPNFIEDPWAELERVLKNEADTVVKTEATTMEVDGQP